MVMELGQPGSGYLPTTVAVFQYLYSQNGCTGGFLLGTHSHTTKSDGCRVDSGTSLEFFFPKAPI